MLVVSIWAPARRAKKSARTRARRKTRWPIARATGMRRAGVGRIGLAETDTVIPRCSDEGGIGCEEVFVRKEETVLLLWFVDLVQVANPHCARLGIEAGVLDASRDSLRDSLTLFDCACSNCRLCESK